MDYFLLESIENDTKDLIDFINKSDKKTIGIFIDCQGGCCHKTEAIINIINNNQHRIYLYSNGYLFSNAFYIFFKSSCYKKTLSDNSFGMYHLKRKDFKINQKGNFVYKEDKKEIQQWKENMEKEIIFLRNLGVSEEDIKKIERGEDVYFNKEQLSYFLKKQKGYSDNYF